MNTYESGYYTLKDQEWLENQRIAGNVLSGSFGAMRDFLIPGTNTKKITDIAEQYIRDNNCIPTFKGYKDFPEAVCISINKELVHGIPKENVILKDGDIIKLDSGATYKESIADMARTYIVGKTEPKYDLLIKTCKDSLNNAIDFIKNNIGVSNKNIRLGDVGYAIKKTASKINANVIMELTGHGLEKWEAHWFPFVYNIGEKNKGLIIHPNMTICIEPMMTYGSNKIKLENDKWTITLQDIGVHEEDTIFVHDNGVEIITQ